MSESLFSEADLDQEELMKERMAERAARHDDKTEHEEVRVFPHRLYIFDGYSMIYRSYFAHISSPLTDRNGNNISAYFGFFSSLLSLMSSYPMDYIAIAMDEKVPTFRHRMYPEYKATRDKAPEDLHAQVPLIKETLDRMHIACISNPGFEADDVIASLSRLAVENSIEAVIVTGDKDLMQLVGPHVSALRPPKKGEAQYRMMQENEVVEEYGVRPSQIVDYLSIIGDKADNVPGIKGLGEKGAVKLLSEYVSLDGIYRHLDMLPQGTRKKLEEGREAGDLSRALIRLSFEALPDGFDISTLSRSRIELAEGIADFDRHDCRSLARRIPPEARGNAAERRDEAVADAYEAPRAEKGVYETLTDIEEVRRHFSEAEKAGGVIALDTETTGLEDDAEMVGFSFSYQECRAYYVPLIAEGREYLSRSDVKALFDEYLASGRLAVVNQNIKYDLKVIWRLGSDIRRIAFDTMIAAWLLDSNANVYNLDDLSLRLLGAVTTKYDEVVGKDEVFSSVPLDKATAYAAEDSDMAFRLYHLLSERLAEKDLLDVLERYELPLIPILARMEAEGIHLSRERIEAMDRDVASRLEGIVSEIYSIAGHEFNLNSTQQLSKVLFEELHLTAGKKTQKGYSTDTATLEGLREEGGAIISDLLDYRQLSKLKSTYIEVLPSLQDKEGRIHTSFLQTGTATGRLSSRNPNLQNIPVRTDEGRMIRSAFTPRPGSVFLSADYSQVELVVLAHMSQDKALMSAFTDGVDVHRYTAGLIFSKDVDAVDAHERRIAKTINFGIMYGMSAFRLARDLGISRSDANDFIARYFERYSSVKAFVEKTNAFASEHGYVLTAGGHRRDVIGINSSNKVEKAGAERVAVNTVIQGTAAEIMKLAMIGVDRGIAEAGLSSKMLLQVHDELIFEVPESEKDAMESLVRYRMENAVKLSIPLRASIEFGSSWGDMH